MATDLENFYRENRIREADSVSPTVFDDPANASTFFNSSLPVAQVEKNLKAYGDRLEPYEPTMRENIRTAISDAGQYLGLPDRTSQRIARGFMGNPSAENFSQQVGLLDIAPVVNIPFYLQEAKRGFDRAQTGSDYIAPALEGGFALLEGALVTKPIAKGLKSLTTSLSKKLSGGSDIVPTKQEVGALPKVLANTKLQAPSMAMVNPRKIDDLGFFYKSEEIANSMQQNKGSGAQFSAFFKNKGVKDSELYDTGLEELFKRDKVTKKDILDNIDLNRLKLQERTYSGSDVSSNLIFEDVTRKLEYKTPEFNKYSQNELDSMDGVDLNDISDGTVSTRVLEDTKTGYKIVYDENGQNFLTYRPNTDIFDIEQSEQARALIAENETLDGFRFDEIAQKGNINEATITTEGIAINNGDFISTDARFADKTQKGGTNYKEYVLRRQSFNPTMAMKNDYVEPDDFQNPIHYDDFNPIFHVRTKDRTTSDGGKTLYIEELQSDRGQQGRKYGFSSGKNFDETVAKYNELNNKVIDVFKDLPIKLKSMEQEYLYQLKNPGKPPIRIPLRSDLSQDQINYFARQSSSDMPRLDNDSFLDFEASRMSDEFKTMKLSDYIEFLSDPNNPIRNDIETLNLMRNIGGVSKLNKIGKLPNKIDFNNLEKEKQLNLLRSALQDIQYSRYDLSKSRHNNQFPDLDTFAGFADDLRNDLRATYNKLQGNVPGGDLVDTTEDWTRLGIKRLLQKAVQGNYDTVTFSPGQIQVDRWGEPGLKNYYDNIIPKMAKEVAGNKNVGIKEVAIEPNDMHRIFMRGTNAMDRRYFVARVGTDRPIAGFDRLEDAQKYAENLDSTEKQKSVAITITPELREKVLKGLSLFTMGGAVLGLEEQMGVLGDIPSTQGDET